MEVPKKYLHDRLILLLITLIGILVVIGVSLVLLRFDPNKNPTTVVAYRPSVSATSIQAGKPIDIYVLAIFMVLTAGAAIFLSARAYPVRRFVAIFILASTAFLLLIATIVANALISIQ